MFTLLLTVIFTVFLSPIGIDAQTTPAAATGCAVIADFTPNMGGDGGGVLGTQTDGSGQVRCQMLRCFDGNVIICQNGNQLETYTSGVTMSTPAAQAALGRGVIGYIKVIIYSGLSKRFINKLLCEFTSGMILR